MTFTLLRSSAELVDPSLLQSVQSVFSSFNWSDRPATQSSRSLDLTMSVQQFFGGFSWEARSIDLTSPVKVPIDRSHQALTLDDFSDLF